MSLKSQGARSSSTTFSCFRYSRTMAALCDEALSCNNLTPRRPNISLIYRFTLWYGNLNSKSLICKENNIHYLYGAHGAFCYARSFASFCCPYFVLYLSLGLIKVNPRLIANDDICERSIVVFRELFQQLFYDSYPSKFLFFYKEMGCPSGTYPSYFQITPENCMSCSY